MADTEQLIGAMLDGAMDEATAAAQLLALAEQGETATDIAEAARAVMARAIHFQAPADAIDVCGTGGDGRQSYNISTAVAFVTAACGVPVVKHGNRGVSSRSGSSDVLAALGFSKALGREFWQHMLETFGIAFLFAPQFHPGLVRMAPIRASLKRRTIFNVLGPLCNPAQVKRQLMGVYSQALVPVIAEVLRERGMAQAWVVHGEDGGDELSISGGSIVAKVGSGIEQARIVPQDAGLPMHGEESLLGGTPEENAAALLDMLNGTKGAYRDSVLLNTAAALVIAGKAPCLADAAALAAETIDRGKALQLLQGLQARARKEAHG